MKTLNTPRSEIISHQGEMFKVLGLHTNRGYDKDKLGHLVKYYGGNKILMSDNILIICELIEEATLEEL